MPEVKDYRDVLYTVDQRGRRKWVYAAVVWGRFRRYRAWLSVGLIAFYLALPFLTVGGLPFLRLDIPDRRFVVAGHVFMPQDISYLLVLILLGIVGTLLAVALAGRVFCGWFCPHNVFLEQVFRPLEWLIVGKASHQKAADRAGGMFWRRTLLLIVYAIVAGALANTATAIFTGTDAFRWGLFIDPVAHPAAAAFFTVFFLLILFNFAWFREQTCTIVCPYGRFQAALMDEHTLGPVYDRDRGEPRGRGERHGDCVDCLQCIAVCPTGVDIRNGNQLECIHCTACVDACNDVMRRLGRAPDLVRMASEAQQLGRPRRVWRARTILYIAVFVALSAFAAWRLGTRPDLLATRLRDTAMPVLVGDGATRAVRSAFHLSLVNRSERDRTVSIALDGVAGSVATAPDPVVVPAYGRSEVHALVTVPADGLGGIPVRARLLVREGGAEAASVDILLRRP